MNGFIEFFVVLLFALGWMVLELVTRRLDRKRAAGTVPRPAAQSTDDRSRGE